MTPYKIYTIMAVIFILSVAAVLAISPSFADFLFGEDSIVEFSGIAIASVTLMLALILAFKGYKKGGVWRFWLAVSFLSFLFIGETLSWGERIFKLKMPRVLGTKFDAIHDLLSIGIGVIKNIRNFVRLMGISDPWSIAIILFSLASIFSVLYLFIKIIAGRKEDITNFFKVNLKKPPFLFLFMAFVLIFTALIVDEDNLVGFPHKEVVDEGLEMLAVLAFLFSCVCGFMSGRWGMDKEKEKKDAS